MELQDYAREMCKEAVASKTRKILKGLSLKGQGIYTSETMPGAIKRLKQLLTGSRASELSAASKDLHKNIDKLPMDLRSRLRAVHNLSREGMKENLKVLGTRATAATGVAGAGYAAHKAMKKKK